MTQCVPAVAAAGQPLGTVRPAEWTAQSLQCTAKSLQCTAQSLQCTAQSLQCTAQSLQCTAELLHCSAEYSTVQKCMWFFSNCCLSFLALDLEKEADGVEEESDQHMVLQVLLQSIGS